MDRCPIDETHIADRIQRDAANNPNAGHKVDRSNTKYPKDWRTQRHHPNGANAPNTAVMHRRYKGMKERDEGQRNCRHSPGQM